MACGCDSPCCRAQLHWQESALPDIAFMLVLVAAPMLFAAWREYVNDNRRDARLLAVLGTGGLWAGGMVWLL